MKSQQEIEQARDLLLKLATGDLPIEMSDEVRILVNAEIDVLEWVLENPKFPNFGLNLKDLEKAIIASCKRPPGISTLRGNKGVPNGVDALAALG